MGSSKSKAQENEGEVVNNIKITTTDNIETMLSIVVILLTFSVVYTIYKDYHRGIKRRYQQQQQTPLRGP
jgi:hypothetical protein